MRILIVSNRLPFTVSCDGQEISIQTSAGGLASGIGSYLKLHPHQKSLWIGWPGKDVPVELQEKCQEISLQNSCQSVFLNKNQINSFYNGFCNNVIWPLFHYFTSFMQFQQSEWESYQQVNLKFAKTIIDNYQEGDIIWVQDYQLMLVPHYVRQQIPDAQIGFFLHIPFPSPEIFRMLPKLCRQEILHGLVSANLTGFHTDEYTQNFLASCQQLKIYNQNNLARTFPIGIDYQKFHNSTLQASVKKNITRFKKVFKSKKVILSIDRLDYSKGILNRLKAFEYFLSKHPEYHQQVVLQVIAVPSRTDVEQYQHTKNKVDELIGRINGSFGTFEWMPIQYQYTSLDFEELTALYAISNIALVTPLRDGMNLVAKEYIAAKRDIPGVLIVSELTGAAEQLKQALIINPYSFEEIDQAMIKALTMSKEEQVQRNKMMQQQLQQEDITFWAEGFIRKLQQTSSVLSKSPSSFYPNVPALIS